MESNALTFPKNDHLVLSKQCSILSTKLKRVWKLLYVPQSSEIIYWLHSQPGVDFVAATNEYFEVAVPVSLDLASTCLDLGIILDYDPAKPTEEKLRILGIEEATKSAHIKFIRNTVLQSDSHPNYGRCCREIARSHGLTTPLERRYLVRDILELSPSDRRHFAQCLVFIGLNLLGNYDSSDALSLLEKNEESALQIFLECDTDPFKSLSPEASIKKNPDAEMHMISLIRMLLEFCSNDLPGRPRAMSQGYRYRDNLALIGSLVGATGANRFGMFDTKLMEHALSKAKVYENGLGNDDGWTSAWSMEIMEAVPIGYSHGYLNLPDSALKDLSIEDIDAIKIYIVYSYKRYPILQEPAHNLLLLLTWSRRVDGQALEVLREWARSDDNLLPLLKTTFRKAQGAERLALSLIALLSYYYLLPMPDDTSQPINGCYLTDLYEILCGADCTNERTVLERIGYSLLRVLSTLKKFEAIHILWEVLHPEAPLLDQFDGFTDQYIAMRITQGHPHMTAYRGVKGLEMLEQCIDDGLWEV